MVAKSDEANYQAAIQWYATLSASAEFSHFQRQATAERARLAQEQEQAAALVARKARMVDFSPLRDIEFEDVNGAVRVAAVGPNKYSPVGLKVNDIVKFVWWANCSGTGTGKCAETERPISSIAQLRQVLASAGTDIILTFQSGRDVFRQALSADFASVSK